MNIYRNVVIRHKPLLDPSQKVRLIFGKIWLMYIDCSRTQKYHLGFSTPRYFLFYLFVNRDLVSYNRSST